MPNAWAWKHPWVVWRVLTGSCAHGCLCMWELTVHVSVCACRNWLCTWVSVHVGTAGTQYPPQIPGINLWGLWAHLWLAI